MHHKPGDIIIDMTCMFADFPEVSSDVEDAVRDETDYVIRISMDVSYHRCTQ